MRSVTPSEQQLALRKGLEGAIALHGKDLDAIEILAVLSHMVGQVIAMQDQRAHTPDSVMQLVLENIQQGNGEAVNALLMAPAGTA